MGGGTQRLRCVVTGGVFSGVGAFRRAVVRKNTDTVLSVVGLLNLRSVSRIF